MDSTAQHIAARDDEDLKKRLVATAEQAHIPNAAGFVESRLGDLVSTKLDGDTTITSVHAYATAQYEAAKAALPPAPGLNPAAVTDAQLQRAVDLLWNPPTEGGTE